MNMTKRTLRELATLKWRATRTRQSNTAFPANLGNVGAVKPEEIAATRPAMVLRTTREHRLRF